MPDLGTAVKGVAVLGAHVRSFLARHRWVHGMLVGSIALATAAILATQSAALERQRRSWGDSRTVWVAADDLAPGDPIVARAVTAPLALVAPTAIVDDPVGSIARRSRGVGEMLVGADVVGTDDIAPPGWRRVAVAADDTTLAVVPGEHVDVTASGTVLTRDGVVVAVGAASVTVAVPAAAAPAVAAAALEGVAVLAAHT